MELRRWRRELIVSCILLAVPVAVPVLMLLMEIAGARFDASTWTAVSDGAPVVGLVIFIGVVMHLRRRPSSLPSDEARGDGVDRS